MAQQLTAEIIDAAIEGFAQQRARIDQKIAELTAMRSGRPVANSVAEGNTGKRKKFSAAARERMAIAQRARWAKLKGESDPKSKKPGAPKTKRKMSKAGRERIIAATKARWARVRAEKEAAAKNGMVGKKAGPKRAAKGTKKAVAPTSVAA